MSKCSNCKDRATLEKEGICALCRESLEERMTQAFDKPIVENTKDLDF